MAAVKFGVQDEAKELAYDDSVSGLAATTIQQAIDQLTDLNEISTYCQNTINTLKNL